MIRYIRSFSILMTVSLALAGCASFSGKNPEAQGRPAYSIMQGVTGAGWTRINLMRTKDESLEVVFQQADETEIDKRLVRNTIHDFAASNEVIEEYSLQGLDVQKTYLMKVYNNGKLVDERRFGLRAQSAGLKFVVLSCADDQFMAEQKIMWRLVAEQKPDLILSLGDHPYADRFQGKPVIEAEPSMLWSRYVDARRNLDLYHYRHLIPVVATWDDHDYGSNGGDRRYKYKQESKQIFLSFFPQRDEQENFVRGPGVASRLAIGEQRFVFLDNRSFRSPAQQSAVCLKHKSAAVCKTRPEAKLGDTDAKKEPETHFGVKQTEWAMNQVRSAGSDVVWLISGDQWFGAYSPFESFEGGYPKDFKRFMTALAGLSDARVAFLSGDRHSAEISEIEDKILGYKSLEVVSSPIHARVYGNNWVEFPNPRQTASLYGAFNFSVIQSDIVDQSWKLKIKSIKYPGEVAFEKDYVLQRPLAE